LGDLDLLAAEIGERNVLDHIIVETGLGLGRHAYSPDCRVPRALAANGRGGNTYKEFFICCGRAVRIVRVRFGWKWRLAAQIGNRVNRSIKPSHAPTRRIAVVNSCHCEVVDTAI